MAIQEHQEAPSCLFWKPEEHTHDLTEALLTHDLTDSLCSMVRAFGVTGKENN